MTGNNLNTSIQRAPGPKPAKKKAEPPPASDI